MPCFTFTQITQRPSSEESSYRSSETGSLAALDGFCRGGRGGGFGGGPMRGGGYGGGRSGNNYFYFG